MNAVGLRRESGFNGTGNLTLQGFPGELHDCYDLTFAAEPGEGKSSRE